MGGSLFLGRWLDPDLPPSQREDARIPADRLTTHAVVIGMTGSGKTGLLVGLLEEASLAGIPALVVDPKGDLADRLLVFPDYREADFAPFCPPGKAGEIAARWRESQEAWGIGAQRARDLAGAPVRVFTPGSSVAPLNVLERFAAPSGESAESLADRSLGAVASLLALAGLDEDPATSPEGLLLNQILLAAWAEGESPRLEDLVQRTLAPPFGKIGILDLDSVLSPKGRTALALRLNALLASPSLSVWRSGPALDLDGLLGPEAGGAQTIVSLAHLSDGERLFFLGLLLSELYAWTRRREGSESLRAMVVFDDLFGYFPPHPADPPTKRPLLGLLKQARAFGVGLVLATQNPVDLDYKGLTNAGLWFLGRLQTEPDRRRVADALGDLPGGDDAADRLAGLPPRTFLVHDVRRDAPRLMETRPCISYLAGPLAPPQIERLLTRTEPGPQAPTAAPAPPAPTPSQGPPPVPAGWSVRYAEGADLVPHLAVEAEVAFRLSPKAPPVLRRVSAAWPLVGTSLEGDLAGEGSTPPDGGPESPGGATYADLPSYLAKSNPAKASKVAAASLARRQTLTLLRDSLSGLLQEPEEGEGAFRARLVPAREDARRRAEEKGLGVLARKLGRAEDKVRRLELELEQDRSEASARSGETYLSAGLGVLGGLLGSKRSIGTAVSRTVSKQRMAERAKGEVAETEAALASARRERDALAAQVEAERSALAARFASADLEAVTLAPSMSGVQILACALLFAPRAEGSP